MSQNSPALQRGGCLVVWQPGGAPATPHTTKRTPQLCVYVLGLLVLRRRRRFLTGGPRRLHLHVHVKSWGGGVSQLLLRCCKYGRRLDEGCLNIKTGANFSGAPRRHRTSGCRDTAAKSCWGRDERRGGRGGGGWEGRAVSHPLGCSGYVLNSRSHMDRTFTLRRVSEVVFPPSWCFLLSKVWSRKAPIIRSGKFPPST